MMVLLNDLPGVSHGQGENVDGGHGPAGPRCWTPTEEAVNGVSQYFLGDFSYSEVRRND